MILELKIDYAPIQESNKNVEGRGRALERVFDAIVAKVKIDPTYDFYQDVWYSEQIIGTFRLK